ncbi:methyltransferase domain-containing protein [Thiohalophilus sp.]|uniref:methyltransferase domain-containing protein n=1 Tax=Thiohalophilus sp. TaxID=3028392 RepID=UPI002ACD6526|nr:methyltransferase domain-containing protein [Thiohalophilus sp.]MDZ7662809.1 methyltransferase domain-containing protein [Thiohalophilus sp.]
MEKHSHLYRGVLYDLGCGETPYKDFFLQYADKYVGVDWSSSYHNTNTDVSANLNEPLPIEPNVADTIVSLSVLEHLCEPQTMLNEAYRILKPGGNIIIQVPWQWQIHEAPYDFFRYTPYGLRYLLEKSGFTDIAIYPQTGYFTTSVMKFNYFTKRCFIRGPKWLRRVMYGVLWPFWQIDQYIAPLLDKIDRNWSLESQGYYVLSKKPT